nr:hypothetical protein [Bacillus pumilus]
MAHKEETIGKFAEMIARVALMAAYWSGVSKPKLKSRMIFSQPIRLVAISSGFK